MNETSPNVKLKAIQNDESVDAGALSVTPPTAPEAKKSPSYSSTAIDTNDFQLGHKLLETSA